MTKTRIILILCLPVVLFLLVEIGLRLFHPAGEMPVIEAKFTNDIPGVARSVQWQFGADGLRTDGWPDSGARILCVGSDNSSPMLQSNKDTWWGLAGADITAKGMPVATGAIGSQGVVASSMLCWIRHVAPALKPTVVVMSFGPGEVLYRPVGYRFVPGSLQTPMSTTPGGWKGTVLKMSQIASHWRLHRQKSQVEAQQADLARENVLRDRMAEVHAVWEKAPVIREMPWIHNPADEIAECLREFAALGKQFKFTPVVVWEPWPQRPGMDAAQTKSFHRLTFVGNGDKHIAARIDPAWVDNRMKAFRMRAQAVADGLGIAMVDASAAFDGTPGMFLDDTVWTDAGAKTMAAVVTPALEAILSVNPQNGK